ncbi:lysozyme, partial [Erwinia amylovora]|uniref:lysozyme n=1 Tax=Erwinia amylovora TaxID=552 RepID=UPI0020BE3184
VKVPLSQSQFDALVSFSYNVGSGALEGSTLLRLLNAGDYDGAHGQFSKWTKAAGVELAGLVRRRAREAEVFGGAVQAPRMAQKVE